MKKYFSSKIETMSNVVSHPYFFALVLVLLVCWTAYGFSRDFDETWFTIIDFAIFVSTFLILFAIQFSKNADTKAMQEKLDAIIQALPQARNSKIAIEKQYKGEHPQ